MQLKTQPTEVTIDRFLESEKNFRAIDECQKIITLFQNSTGFQPTIWGSSIIGFGSYEFQYASGKTSIWFLSGFAPRKSTYVFYIMGGFAHCETLLSKLGKHKTGKGCLYVKELLDIDFNVLEKIILQGIENLKNCKTCVKINAS